MSSTDGLQRGMQAIDLNGPISVPVGEQVLGRIVNVLGDTIDQGEPLDRTQALPIHRPALMLARLSRYQHYARDRDQGRGFIGSLRRGGKIGLFGGKSGKNNSYYGINPQYRLRTRRLFGFCRCRERHEKGNSYTRKCKNPG